MGYRVSIIGATGAVGQEFMTVLERRRFPVDRLRLFASPRSAGKQMKFGKTTLTVEAFSPGALKGEQVVLLSAGSDFSKEYAPALAAAGSLVVDNSSAFRMDPKVPLIIPEINGDQAIQHQGLIAVPNCTTIILLMPLAPLHRMAKAKRVIVSSYQAASGKGAKGLEELEIGLSAALKGEPLPAKAFPHPLAMNVVAQVDQFLEDGSTKEEWKVLRETQRILRDESIQLDITCVRVPVRRCHSEAVTVEFDQLVTPEDARKAWSSFPGLKVLDEPLKGGYPHPLMVEGRDDVYVGRCRPSLCFAKGLSFWCVGDQLLKGAALNAVQIAEAVLKVKPALSAGGKAWT